MEVKKITDKELFDWVRANQDDGRLLQEQVDAIDTLLAITDAASVVDILSKVNGWGLPSLDNKSLTKTDIVLAASKLGVEYAALKAVIEIEARSSGFDKQGRPTILFERHKLWSELGKINYFTWRKRLNAEHPDVCSPSAGSYNTRGQYEKLAIASAVDWDAAHKSASWGLGQIMGFNAESLGYPTLKDFIDDMYESEAKQLDAMCRFIKANNLVPKLQKHDWAGFARGYNGSAYAINKYDVKLKAAYDRHK